MDRDNLTESEPFDLDEIIKLLDEPTVIYNEEGAESGPTAQSEESAALEPELIPTCAPASQESAKPEESRKEPGPKMPLGKTVALYLHDMVYLLVAVVVLLTLCFRMVIVDGASMYDTLVDGDYLLLLNNVIYRDPQPGDIVVASKDSFRDGDPIVKRVIATEGQVVNIDFSTGQVFVDGELLVEDYIYSPTTNPEGMSFPLVVEDGCIFVMGDNRGRSMDSRDPEIGLIDEREIMGRAIFLLIPGDNEGNEQRDFSRVGVIS